MVSNDDTANNNNNDNNNDDDSSSPPIIGEDNNNNTSERQQQEHDQQKATKTLARQARSQYLQERQLSQMRSLLVQGATEQQVCDIFKFHRSTFHRWVKKLEEQDRKILKDNYQETVMLEISRVRDVFKMIEQHMGRILKDKEAENLEKVEAAHLLGEVAATGLKILTDGPVATLNGMPVQTKKKLTLITEHIAENGSPSSAPIINVNLSDGNNGGNNDDSFDELDESDVEEEEDGDIPNGRQEKRNLNG